MKLDFDEALERAGGFGYIQRIHFSLMFLVHVFGAPFVVSLVFIGKEPTYACKDRPAKDPCQLQPPCTEFVYGKDFSSIVSEWNLVCEHRRDTSYAQSLLMFGFLLGVIFLGRTSDKYGRLKTFVCGMLTAVVVQFASAFSQDVHQYMLSRFLVGFLAGGASLAARITVVEALAPRHRAIVSTVYHCAFAISLAIFAAMAYSFRDWRQLTIVTCVPNLLFLIIPLGIPESARWLASRGRIEEAENQLLHFARKNRIAVRRSAISLADKTDDSKTKGSTGILDLFHTPELRRRMIILMFMWFTCCMTYYGLTFEASKLGGNMYLNFALSGLVEIPACLLSIYALNYSGRRPTMAMALALVGSACLGVMFLPRTKDGEMSTAQTCLALIGKMGISVAFNSAYLFSSEILPTVLRNTAVGVCSMTARVGGIVAPTLPPLGANAAYLVFGIFALASSVLCLTLPESLNKQLPQTVKDIENGMIRAMVPPTEKHNNSIT